MKSPGDALPEGPAFPYADKMTAAASPLANAPHPLVCMDSGVGGLAVLSRLIHAAPHSPYVFLGDTAWMPYGEKALETVRSRVLAVHRFLHETYAPAVFVLACNTATVAAYDILTAQGHPYPILEPVETTAAWVNRQWPAGGRIGVLATPATVSTGRYRQALAPCWQVHERACPGLASRVEAGEIQGEDLMATLHPYLLPLQEAGVDRVILGCTHYSFIQEAVEAFMGPAVTVIDSAEVLAREALPVIQRLGVLQGTPHLLVTGDPQPFAQRLDQLGLTSILSAPVTRVDVTVPGERTILPR